jgi:hypothetical protein
MQLDEYPSDRTDFPQTERAFCAPAWIALLPVSVVALGSARQPIERLLGLQSAIAKGVYMVTAVRQIRLRLAFHGLLKHWPNSVFHLPRSKHGESSK